MLASKEMIDKIEEALKSSSRNDHWLNKLADGEQREFMEWLTQLFISSCATAQDNIIEQIVSIMSDKMDGMESKYEDVTIDVAARNIDQFKSLLNEAISEVKDIQRKESKRIDALQFNDRRQDARLDTMEHQNRNMSIKIDHVEGYAKQIPSIYDAINSLHDTVNLSLSSRSENKKQQNPGQQNQSIIDKIPTRILLAASVSVGVALAVTAIYLLTGELVDIKGWLK